MPQRQWLIKKKRETASFFPFHRWIPQEQKEQLVATRITHAQKKKEEEDAREIPILEDREKGKSEAEKRD